MIKIGRSLYLFQLPLFFTFVITVNSNETSSILYSILLFFGMILAAVNLIRFKEFKRLKVENELLKFKLKDCEQRGTGTVHEEC